MKQITSRKGTEIEPKNSSNLRNPLYFVSLISKIFNIWQFMDSESGSRVLRGIGSILDFAIRSLIQYYNG